ncbi:metalloregulator ArsR/SmtB family transcription factor [Ottowia sp.]|jgi:DNA-binding transcriptional ArsR family regulator|uniref:ArsR/SmtB family transcription factor n=1 Tax=Ottowia sp. TaxID=1898956 RepID=UPI0025E316ED|nr:metalloregulator ArsR/SmtB family transcription factor [Ottowia sp.]
MTDTRPYSQRQKMSAPTQDALRAQAINSAMAVLDDPLFKALQEPSRVAVLRQLMLLGRADVGQIAEKLPQERSVISRHLQLLLEAGIVRMERAGRHRIYEVDGPTILRKFEVILREVGQLAPYCCPANGSENK